MGQQTKIAKQVIASQIKVAAQAVKQMKAAVKANDIQTAVTAAKRLQQANETAEKAVQESGSNLSDAQLKKLGYVSDEGGTWGLDIPLPVCTVLANEKKARLLSEINVAEASASAEGRQLTDEELVKFGFIQRGNNVWENPTLPKVHVRK